MLRALILAVLIALTASPAYAQGLSGFLSPGPLAEPHADLDALTQCSKCHEAGKGVSAARCLDCHTELRDEIRAKKGFHADKADRCETCHLDHRGRGFDMVHLQEQTFDHASTGFPLRGGHAEAACLDCHEADTWRGLDATCERCHEDIHGAAKSTRALTKGCATCHTDRSWVALPIDPKIFDHGDDRHAAFALEGAHEDVACEDCHADARFLPTAHEACVTCHADPHGPRFSDDCTTCHTVVSWKVGAFDHAVTGFALEGQHRQVGCKSCHGNDVTRPVKHETCNDCHADVHRGQFAPRTCDSCHTVDVPDFQLASFDHSIWPLEGEHGSVACAECHGDGPEATYAQTSTECVNCHEDPHAGKFQPQGCDTCHSPHGWSVEDFDHGRTDFPLTGAHTALDCADCHEPHAFSGLAHESCADCHADHPHDGAVGVCADCHVTDAWSPVTFDHAVTGFLLAPQHTEATCTDCHQLTRFGGLDGECVDCHEPHRPAGHYDGACSDCHQGAHWMPGTLGPLGHAVTGFALHGTHERLECESCHAPDEPKGLVGTACVGCHAADDVHRNMLGDQCNDCHSEGTWVKTRWRHQLTGWPLRGAHRLAACDDCHAAGYVGTPTDCFRCHGAEAPASIPAHQSSFFRDCEQCHKPYTWATPQFVH